ncbi:divalent-cation tolerance protein CutA [Dictyobacter vulcani]|uniref:Divalent-cation tolerance protein CutA n=1 Tax=Dictyobacter vulcani TaxID=2607529 RepID=A0A5J4KS84_9CHLR|nr:divalent-cation tolerance protein CutA [Dictyobacter vulcani]GER88949.1 divalent-cation tolerance protein CutA [Dictyobacter vulcani]
MNEEERIMDRECIEVHTTIDTREGEQKIAESLVGSHLAACVQVSGPITSTYWWKGQIETAQEWTCTAKTRKDLYSAVEQAIRVAHSYEEPEIVAHLIVAGSKGYLDWIVKETTAE